MPYLPKITKARFVYSPFSAEQMSALGDVMCQTIKIRIKAARNGEDQAAKPLIPGRGRNVGRGYPERKIKRGLLPIRDWTFTGRTLGFLKVLRADENRVVIGFADEKADFIAHLNNLKERAFTTSPKDHETLAAALTALLHGSRTSANVLDSTGSTYVFPTYANYR